MANKFIVTGAQVITKATKSASVLVQVPLASTNEHLDYIDVNCNLGNMPDEASGSIKLILRDNTNALVYQKVIAGQIGVPSLFDPKLQYAGVLQVVCNETLGQITLNDDAGSHFVRWGVSPASFSTGSIEAEFSGGISDQAFAYMTSQMLSFTPYSYVQLAGLKMDGKGQGTMGIKINFSCVAV